MLDKEWDVDNIYSTEVSADIKDRNKRMQICNECENLTKFKFCKLCNCPMPIKTYLKSKKCLIGKW